MRALSASQVVGVWERGLDQHPIDRALTVLEAGSGESRDRLAALSIGRRDAGLLELHEMTFGGALDAFTECPECAERLEYSISAAQLQVAGSGPPEEEAGLVVAGGRSFRLRPPDSRDLAAVAAAADAQAARRILARRCLRPEGGAAVAAESSEKGAPYDALPTDALCQDPLPHDGLPDEALSEEVLAQVASHVAKADPLAEVLIALQCAACGFRWQEVFDIESFLWAKVSAAARRLLREVHVLALAYGWSEVEIMSLSAVRRRFYLEMVS